MAKDNAVYTTIQWTKYKPTYDWEKVSDEVTAEELEKFTQEQLHGYSALVKACMIRTYGNNSE